MSDGDDILRFPPFELDPVRGVLRDDSGPVVLQDKPLLVLLYLITHRDRLVSKDELLAEVWADSSVGEGSVTTAIGEIRRALGDDSVHQNWVRTVRGEGFRFVGDLDERAPAQRFAGRRPTAAALAAFAILVAVSAVALWQLTRSPDVPRTLVVLPFDDLSPSADQAHLALGLTEELISSLTRIRGLHVIGRTTGQVVKAKGLSIREIGEQLGVDAVIEGSVRKTDERLRVTVQLIDVADETHLWSESYDRPLGDALLLQDEIAAAVARSFALEHAGSHNRASLENPRAWELTRFAQGLNERLTEEGIRAAIVLHQQALELVPDFAPAHAGLANSWEELCNRNHEDCAVVVPLARAAAERALALDDQLWFAHFAHAEVLGRDYDWEGAERAYRRAIELSGGDPLPRSLLGFMLVRLGRTDEGLAELDEAIRLDPLSPGKLLNAAFGHGVAGDPARAVELVELARRLDPANSAVILGERNLHDILGNSERATELTLAFGFPAEVDAVLREAAAQGDSARFAAILLQVVIAQSGQPCGIDFISAARLRTLMGDREGALTCLEEGARGHGFNVGALLKASPQWDMLRDDPRFEAILEQMNLAD